jgi:cytochrome c
MKTTIASSLFAAAIAASPIAGLCAERATPAEAKELLKKAEAHYKLVGRKQALADFSLKKGPFVDRELYVVCVDGAHKVVANGAFPSYVGAPVDVLKDATGKPLGAAIVDAAAGKNGGVATFTMLNPVSGKQEPKLMYARKFGEDACGVGVYKP